jgi:predicted PurR-regulated permease PerM
MVNENKITTYLSWAIIILVIVVSYFILKDFLVAIAAAFVIAYLLKPIYDKLEGKLGKSAAALTTILSVLIIFLLTIGFIVGSLISEISTLLSENTIQAFIDQAKGILFEQTISENISNLIKEAGKITIDLVKNSAADIPSRLLAVFVAFFTAYYILIDWDNLKKKVTEFLPFKNRNHVMKKIEMQIKDIIVGTFLLALLEATIAGIAFYLLGVKFAILLGFLIGVFAFVPALGPLLVWIPVAIIEFTNGNIGTAIGVTIVGLFLSTYVDSIVRIKLVGKKSNIHPVVMLVGLFGGISLFGIMGFILGPLILSILITIIENTPRLEFE